MDWNDPEQVKAYYRAYQAALYAANPQKARALRRAWRAANREKDNTRARAWRRAHPEKVKATIAAWRAAHAEHIKAKRRARYLANAEQNKAAVRAWRTAHPERHKQALRAWRTAHKKERKIYMRAWDAAHPEQRRAIKSRQYARKRDAPINNLTRTEWGIIKAQFQYRCAYCGKKPKRLTKDHITPLSAGGSHTLSNIVPACQSCNSKKYTGPPLVPVQPLLC